MVNTAPPASNSVYGREKLFWYDKIKFSNRECRCGAVVEELLERADKPGSASLFSVSLYRFFFSTIFPFGLFFFILTAVTAGPALRSIYILTLSPEFYIGKGISKALDLHTGQAYDQIKTINCQDMSLLWNSWIFSMLVDIKTNTHSTPQTVLIYTHHPPVTHWRKLNLPFVHRL